MNETVSIVLGALLMLSGSLMMVVIIIRAMRFAWIYKLKIPIRRKLRYHPRPPKEKYTLVTRGGSSAQ